MTKEFIRGNARITGNLIPTGKVFGYATNAPATIETAGPAAFTVAQLLGGLILRDPAGNNRTDTLPTAADLVAGLSGAVVGSTIDFAVSNTADQAETITIGATTIAQAKVRLYRARLTNVTPGSEAFTLYSLGVADA